MIPEAKWQIVFFLFIPDISLLIFFCSFIDPYTLPCNHSFCRQPCIISSPSQTHVRCHTCYKEAAISTIVSNVALSARVQNHHIKERFSRVRTCVACSQTVSALIFCKHCQMYVCQSCREDHFGLVSVSRHL